MNAGELEEMLQRAATNGREISREDFYNIMTKKSIWSVKMPIILNYFDIDKKCILQIKMIQFIQASE